MTATMSPVHRDDFDESPQEPSPQAPATVVVRRNAGLSALIGAGASAVAIAYLWRASQSGAVIDWGLCAVMAGIAVFYLAHLVDARTPLMVADDLGVRIRLGNQWRGLPWDGVGEVVVHPRRGLLEDGRLLFGPHSVDRPLEGLEPRGRRAAALNQRLYGAALAVPMGLTTRVSAGGVDVADGLAALAGGRAEVSLAGPAVDPAAGPAGDPAGDAGPEAADPAVAGGDDAPPYGDAGVAEQHRPAGLVPQEPEAAEPQEAHELQPEDEEPEELRPEDRELEDREPDYPEDPDSGEPRRSLLGGLAVIVSRVAKDRPREAPATADEEDVPAASALLPDDEPAVRRDGDALAARSTVPLLRATRRALRADVVREHPAAVLGNAALVPDTQQASGATALPESDELRRRQCADDGTYEEGARPVSLVPPAQRVAGMPTMRGPVEAVEPVEPPVFDDLAPEPVRDPVIGPELAVARVRVGLSVDELAERTRIRPHVIESIEVDDFAPCGGDFYARGHLRTLARVLGRDVEPLLRDYDDRYATAPINARRVFEAELATGMTGSMRSTLRGPSWSILVAAVLVLVVTWGAVRLLASEPTEVLQTPAPLANGSATVPDPGVHAPTPATGATPVRLDLVAAQGSSRVVVRDRDGTVVWAGRLVLGRTRTIRALPPVRVRARDAGAIEVAVDGVQQGPVGPSGQVARRTFLRPEAR